MNQYDVKIEKLTNLGMGLAHIDNLVAFVDGVCPEDEVRIEVTGHNKHYAKAKVIEILKPSPHRTEPFCPLQKVCGACQLQFIDYNYQLQCKKEIVQETMDKIGGLSIEIPTPIPSPLIKNFRHKIQYPISQTKNSGRILAGYYKPSSHEIVNIKYCPIQPEICDSIIEYIRQAAPKYGVSGYTEKNHKGDLRHIVIRNSSINNENLVVLVINDSQIQNKYKQLAKDIYDEFEEVCGVCINFNNKKTNVILGNKTECLYGDEYIEESILDKKFVIGAETFFQVNPKSAENIFKYVKDYISNNFKYPTVLDAYAGISAFGIVVSDIAKNVVTIEENLMSVKLAKQCADMNKIKNIEIHGGDAGKFFESEKRNFEVVILDPPRKGCTQESLEEALKLCSDTIIYVSCNPATLARDLKYLAEKGCHVESIQPFDMFCHTYHIENVAIIKI